MPAFNPYSLDPSQILASMQNNALTTNIYEGTAKSVGAINDTQRLMTSEFSNASQNAYDGTSKTINAVNDTQRLMTNEFSNANQNIYGGTSKTVGAINDTQRLMTSEFSNVNKNIFDTIAQNSVSIERNGAAGTATSERVGYQVASAVERNGASGMNTTERVGGNVGVAVERNGGNILATVERIAGEGRLTTTVVDAASRQAANDSARDILRGVDRNGLDAITTTKDAYNGLLASVERNAGETRLASAIGQGQTDLKLTDVRHSILNDVNRNTNEVIGSGTQNFNVLNKAVTDSAWEQRTASAVGFQNVAEEHLRTKFDLAAQGASHYASSLLENQKIKEGLAMQGANHYASSLLESQKIREHLSMQGATNYASNLLENQKNKEQLASHSAMQFAAMVSKTDGHAAGLAKQMDNHYASLLLEQQKSKECLSLQLQEAKYEALKNKMELSKEMGDCCCEIKQKVDQRSQEVIATVDTLDRNRLRDEVNTTSNENNLLKFAEFGPWGGYGGGYGGYGGEGREGRGRDHHRRR